MNILHKIRSQPLYIRKIILWVVVMIVGLGLATLYIKNFQQKLKSFKMDKFKEELKLPEFKEELSIPKIEIPTSEIEERIEGLEEIIKKAEEESSSE